MLAREKVAVLRVTNNRLQPYFNGNINPNKDARAAANNAAANKAAANKAAANKLAANKAAANKAAANRAAAINTSFKKAAVIRAIGNRNKAMENWHEMVSLGALRR